MGKTVMLMGLFHESTDTADAIDRLYEMKIPEEDILVMTGVPYPEQALGRHSEWLRLPVIVLVGALTGFLFGVFLAVGTPTFYPLTVGGRPIITGPPAVVIIFVFTMMATIVSTFLGVLWEMGFPSFENKYYHRLVTSGHLAVLVECLESQVDDIHTIMETHNGHHIQSAERMAL